MLLALARRPDRNNNSSSSNKTSITFDVPKGQRVLVKLQEGAPGRVEAEVQMWTEREEEEENNKLRCPECGYQAHRRDQLRRHRAIHQERGMVDNFQKQWEALKVPYPKDTLSSQIEQQAAQEKTNYDKFVSESKTRIQGINQADRY